MPPPVEGEITAVVAVGASAGGLDPIRSFFEAVPTDTGACFVVLQHLSPLFKSQMPALLSRRTSLPVQLAENGVDIAPNTIWLIPPRRTLTVRDGRLHLEAWDQDDPRMHFVIDKFFRSVALEYKDRGVGIVLSGTGTDGTLGAGAIHAAGGLVLVQSTESSQFDGMPRSVINAGLADRMLPPVELARDVRDHCKLLQLGISVPQDPAALVSKVLGLVDASTSPTTLLRHLQRRSRLTRASSLEDYLDKLDQDPEERRSLSRDLHISLGSFFAGPHWETLETRILPRLLAALRPDEELRCWVAGCTTGETAYSLALLAREIGESLGGRAVRVYATDDSAEALEVASQGWYPASAIEDMTPQRKERWLVRTGSGATVGEELRGSVVFAQTALAMRSPFQHVHLGIATSPTLQTTERRFTRTLALLSDQLADQGILCVGHGPWSGRPIEGLKELEDHVYDRLPASATGRPSAPRVPPAPRISMDRASFVADLLARRAVCLYVDTDGRVTSILGSVEGVLRTPSEAHPDVRILLPSSLVMPLTAAMQRARTTGNTVSYRGLPSRTPSDLVDLHIAFHPSSGTRPLLFSVVVEPSTPQLPTPEKNSTDVHITEALERELSISRDNLQSIIEQLEATHEETHASNEELMASNEELQSSNEELQSVNEELHSLNSEHQERVMEMTTLHESVDAIVASAGVGMVLLDPHLHILRFASPEQTGLPLDAADIGRPLDNLRSALDEDLAQRAREVLEHGHPQTLMARHDDGSTVICRLSRHSTGGQTQIVMSMTRTRSKEQTVSKTPVDRFWLRATSELSLVEEP